MAEKSIWLYSRFCFPPKNRTFAQEDYKQLWKIGLTVQLNEPKERKHTFQMESWAILEGNSIPFYALLLRNTHMDWCTVAGSFLILMAQWRLASYELAPQISTTILVTNHGKIAGKCFSLTRITCGRFYMASTNCILERCQATYPKSDGDKCEQFMRRGWVTFPCVLTACHSWGYLEVAFAKDAAFIWKRAMDTERQNTEKATDTGVQTASDV